MEIIEQLAALRETSPAVDKYLSQKLYLLDYHEDDVTEQRILSACYLIVVQDLADLGVRLTTDLSMVLGDFYSAESLYYLRKWLDAVSLFEFFKGDDSAKDAILAILHTREIHQTEKIQAVIDFLTEKYPHQYHIDRIADLRNLVHSDESFIAHIEAVVDSPLLTPVPALDIHNLGQVNQFLAKIAEGRQAFAQAVNAVLRYDSTLNGDYLRKTIRDYDLQKTAPSVLNIYTWAVLTPTQELAPEMQQLQQHYLREHQEATSHHIEHYLVHRDQPILKEHLVELVAHHCEPASSTETEFRTAVTAMIEQGTDKAAPLFTQDQVNYILELTNFLVETLYHPVDPDTPTQPE